VGCDIEPAGVDVEYEFAIKEFGSVPTFAVIGI